MEPPQYYLRVYLHILTQVCGILNGSMLQTVDFITVCYMCLSAGICVIPLYVPYVETSKYINVTEFYSKGKYCKNDKYLRIMFVNFVN